MGILCNGTQIEIEHNNFFENDTSILFSRAYYSTPSNPNINENNFFQLSGYAIKLDAWTTSGNVDAENNYWNSQNIDALIYDKHDLPALENEVIYIPIENNVFPNAGA